MNLTDILGDDRLLEWWQMAIRAVIVFFVMIIYIRVGGKRAFAEWGALDIVLSVIIGSVLSRAITGNSPFFPTLVAGLVLVALHRLIALIAFHSNTIGPWVKGNPNCLVKDGEFNKKIMQQKQITKHDLEEAMRLNGMISLDEIDSAYLERNGRISIIPKNKKF